MLLNVFEIIQESDKIHDNDITYIKGWTEHLKNNKSEIVRASCLAENAVIYFLDTVVQQIQFEQATQSATKKETICR